MAYSLEQIFHTEPKVIGMIEIYSNPIDKKTVQDIEKVIKNIAKSFRINLDNIPSGETLKVFIYPSKRVFYQFFGSEIEKRSRKLSRTQEDMLFVVGEGEIHMVSPKATGKSYTNMIKILVKDILSEYELDEKVKKAQEKVTDELEPKDEELEDEEIDEEELAEEEQEIDEEELDELEHIDEQIEKIKEQSEKTIPEWLDLGWIMYKRQILLGTKNREDFAYFIKEKGVKSANKISSKQSVMGEYNYASESSAAIIEYIVTNYGVRKIVDLFENPDVEQVLGISKDKFKRESKAWIKQRYVSSKVKELNEEKEDIEVIVKEKDEK